MVGRSSFISFRTKVAENEQNFANKFDYVMVFAMENVPGTETFKQSPEAKHYIRVMLEENLVLFPYLSVQGDELIVLIQCPVRVVLKYLIFLVLTIRCL